MREKDRGAFFSTQKRTTAIPINRTFEPIFKVQSTQIFFHGLITPKNPKKIIFLPQNVTQILPSIAGAFFSTPWLCAGYGSFPW